MHLLRCMFFFMAHFQFEYHAPHLPRSDNRVADAQSGSHLDIFHSLRSQVPTAIPQALSERLLERRFHGLRLAGGPCSGVSCAQPLPSYQEVLLLRAAAVGFLLWVVQYQPPPVVRARSLPVRSIPGSAGT